MAVHVRADTHSGCERLAKTGLSCSDHDMKESHQGLDVTPSLIPRQAKDAEEAHTPDVNASHKLD